MANPKAGVSFAELGTIFNDATTKLVGGVWDTVNAGGNQASLLDDLQQVQTGLQSQLNAGQFKGLSFVHVQEIIDQLNQEIEAVKETTNGGLGANNGQGAVGSGTVFGPDAPKAINDLHRDIIDIVQGDETLAALATTNGANGFQTVPDLLSPATPFADNEAQTAFLAKFVSDSNSLGERAVNLVGSGDTAAINTLIQDIHTYQNDANTFVNAQDPLYIARFANEFALNGNAGSLGNTLIKGLQDGDAELVQASATALAQNAADVNSNNVPFGTTPPAPEVTAANAPTTNLAEIGAIFNDATTRMIGGIDGTNKDAVLADLQAAHAGLTSLIDENPEIFAGLTGIKADAVARNLALEIQAVNNVGIDPTAAKEINDIHRDVIDIVQGDANLQNMASQGGISGFAPVPDLLADPAPFADNADQTAFFAQWIAQSNSLGQQAQQLVNSGDTEAINGLIDQLHQYENFANDFSFAQGGVFSARFNNELAHDSVLGSEVAALVKGLQTGNAALVTAAAQEMHDNASDVAGNNAPFGGGTYNADGTTPTAVLPAVADNGGAVDGGDPGPGAGDPGNDTGNPVPGAGNNGQGGSHGHHGHGHGHGLGHAVAQVIDHVSDNHGHSHHHFEHLWG